MATFLIEYHKAVEFCRATPYYEPTSNIRFAQLTAEAKAAMLFPEFKNASKWLSDVAPQISNQFTCSSIRTAYIRRWPRIISWE